MSNLLSGHMGNGLVVWRKGEDMSIAHINPDRTIKTTQYVTIEELKKILHIAKYDDRYISITQKEKVFKVKPIKNK